MQIALERAPLERGQVIVVGVGDPEREGRRWYHSRVAGRGPGTLVIETPVELLSEAAGALAPGREVVLHTWRVTDARYTLRARLLGFEGGWVAPDGLLRLQVLEALRVERRSFFRVPINLQADAAYVLDEAGERHPLRLLLCDLSAGGLRARISAGMKARTPALLHVGQLLELQLSLPGQAAPLNLRARVVRVEEGKRTDGQLTEIGAAFTDLDTETQERLIRFALGVQHRLLRQGML